MEKEISVRGFTNSYLSVFYRQMISLMNSGDIMSSKVNIETSILLKGEYLPMERVVLTANGNLQRIMRLVELIFLPSIC
jgi:hypothetical protein